MSDNHRTALSTIVVLGDGLLGHIAAVALRRALPKCEVILAVIDNREPLQAEASLILPATIHTLDLVGLDEETLVRTGCASHRLCERFDGWGNGPFVVDPADQPRLVGAALHQLWLTHGDMPFEALLPAAVLTQAGRFMPTDGLPVEPALAIAPERVRDLLVRAAQRCGVFTATVARDAIVRGDSDATVMTFANGRTVVADLVVEAAAVAEPRGTTLSAHVRALPGPPLLHDQYQRTARGWRARWCGATGGQEVVVSADPDGEGLREAEGWRPIGYRVTAVATPFIGNRVMLAAAPGPFLRLGLSLSLRLLALLIDLLPGREPEPLLIGEYNRRAKTIIDDAFSFAATFDIALDRETDSAADALAAFGHNGRLPPDCGELLGVGAWQSLLTGLGIRPTRADPLARSVPAQRGPSALHEWQRQVAGLAGRMPSYATWLNAARRQQP